MALVIILSGVAFYVALGTFIIRQKGVRWSYSVLLGLLPGAFPLLMGGLGFLIGGLLIGSCFKMKVPN